MEDQVILVLGEDRIEALRENLITKSKYFASLFSPNFRDSFSHEHRINYDIDTNTLQTFVEWASEDEAAAADTENIRVKPSLKKFVQSSSDFEEILQLLQLSVLFLADTLSNDLTDLIACHWLVPQNSLRLWLTAKELNLVTLRNLAQATCLEYLDKVPESSLLQLSGEDFISLLENVLSRAHPDLLVHLAQQWKLRNLKHEISTSAYDWRFPFTLLAENFSLTEFRKQCEEQRLNNNIECIVGSSPVKDNTPKVSIYSWDGTIFSELVELRRSANALPNIVGRQILGRGFDIYLVGGEYGLGTGRFEMEIWRYSTILRNWYYVTRLPEPRRHMGVKFLKEKLFLIGGVGRHRLKLTTVAVYDIDTGKWSKAADVPEDFILIPPVFDIGDNLVIYNSALYEYDLKTNSWTTSGDQFRAIWSNEGVIESVRIIPDFLTFVDGYLYIVESGVSITRIWMVEELSSHTASHLCDCVTPFDNPVANGRNLFGFSYKNGKVLIEVIKLGGPKLSETILVHSEDRSDLLDLNHEAPFSCFNPMIFI